MEPETYVPTPSEIGVSILGYLLFGVGNKQKKCAVLETLLYVLHVPKATLAKMTGLTRARIGQFHDEPVPDFREEQFYTILLNMTDAMEENLNSLEEKQEHLDAEVKPETVPLARAIIKTCRKVLAAEKGRLYRVW